jgi:hypothetical protein
MITAGMPLPAADAGPSLDKFNAQQVQIPSPGLHVNACARMMFQRKQPELQIPHELNLMTLDRLFSN